ncbi:MAG: LamG domain-containing protein [Desulfobacterales bacterium]|nr:LamG domain-containing protein [Desulfobacterales bacterium]
MPPTGSDISIWKSGKGHGIECPETGWISLRYDHGRKKLEPVQYGGQWWIEGLQLYMPCQTLGAYYAAPSYISNFIPDNIGVKKHASMHGGYITGGPNFKFNDRSLYLPLSHSSCVALYGNWDIFENKSVDFTIGGWVCFQGPAGGHTVTGVYQDSNNYWLLYRMTDTKMSFQKINNGIVEIQAISNITIPNAQWSFVVAVIKGGNIGLYVDGQQESWAESSSWNESPISGTLFFGKSGNNTLYADIKIKDMFLCKQNLFDAEPNEGLLDSIYLPKNILNLGMEK